MSRNVANSIACAAAAALAVFPAAVSLSLIDAGLPVLAFLAIQWATLSASAAGVVFVVSRYIK